MIYPAEFPLSTEVFAEHLLREVPNRSVTIMRQGIPETTAWTLSVKEVLAELGKELADKHEGLRSIYTDRSVSMREFMLDFVWWSATGAVLACECEWGNSRYLEGNPQAVVDDFEKLLCFKSPMKLMIFDSYKSPDLQSKCLALINDYLSGYPCHIEGEQYLLIDFCATPSKWRAAIKKNGVDTSLAFVPFQ